MRVHFEAHGRRSELELEPGTWTVGGGPDDGVRFPGLPSRLLELEVGEERVWVRCSGRRRVGRALVEPGIRRWLVPGERVELSRHAVLWLEPLPGDPGTVAVVRALLEAGAIPPGLGGAALRCVAGPDAGAVFPLVGSVAELGRLPGCAVRLSDGAVSRRHLAFLSDGARHRVQDLGGRNPARCNGRPLRSGRLLRDGDVLAVGRSLLHYRAGATGEADPRLTAETTRDPSGGVSAVSASARGPPARPAAPSAGGAA